MKARKIEVTVSVETDVDVYVDLDYILDHVDDNDLKEALEDRGFIVLDSTEYAEDRIEDRGFIVLDSTEYAEDRISFDEMTLAIKALEADLRAPGPRNNDVWNLVEKLYRLRTL